MCRIFFAVIQQFSCRCWCNLYNSCIYGKQNVQKLLQQQKSIQQTHNISVVVAHRYNGKTSQHKSLHHNRYIIDTQKQKHTL